MNYSNLESQLTTFLESLNIEKFNYNPSLKGSTAAGENISLGFICRQNNDQITLLKKKTLIKCL